jgi:hypothetical protein
MQEGDNVYDALVLSKKRWEKKRKRKIEKKNKKRWKEGDVSLVHW